MIEILLQAERELTMDRLDQAERLYWQAIEADPRNAIAVVGLARVAVERADDRTAYAFAVQALGIDPEDAVALRLEQRLAEVMAARGEPVQRPAFVVAASDAAQARARARIEAAQGRYPGAPGPPAAPSTQTTAELDLPPAPDTAPPGGSTAPGRSRGLFRRFRDR